MQMKVLAQDISIVFGFAGQGFEVDFQEVAFPIGTSSVLWNEYNYLDCIDPDGVHNNVWHRLWTSPSFWLQFVLTLTQMVD